MTLPGKRQTKPSNLVVVLNSDKLVESHRDHALSENQIADLEKIDEKLNIGFQVERNYIQHPAEKDKITYIANLLAKAMLDNDEAKIAILCTYLATRYQDLKQVKVDTLKDRLSIQLIYDEEFQEQKKLKFVPRNKLSS